MVLLKMLMEIALPKMVELLVMMMTMISPSGREVPPAKSLRRRAKVLLPKFYPETVALHPKCPLLFFLGQKTLYTRRWASEVGQGPHYPPGHAWRGGCGLVPSGHLGGLLQYLFSPIFLYIPK